MLVGTRGSSGETRLLCLLLEMLNLRRSCRISWTSGTPRLMSSERVSSYFRRECYAERVAASTFMDRDVGIGALMRVL